MEHLRNSFKEKSKRIRTGLIVYEVIIVIIIILVFIFSYGESYSLASWIVLAIGLLDLCFNVWLVKQITQHNIVLARMVVHTPEKCISKMRRIIKKYEVTHIPGIYTSLNISSLSLHNAMLASNISAYYATMIRKIENRLNT